MIRRARFGWVGRDEVEAECVDDEQHESLVRRWESAATVSATTDIRQRHPGEQETAREEVQAGHLHQKNPAKERDGQTRSSRSPFPPSGHLRRVHSNTSKPRPPRKISNPVKCVGYCASRVDECVERNALHVLSTRFVF